jgi:hypothetical protein
MPAIVPLDPGAGAPTVDILIGEEQFGSYRFFLRQPGGGNPSAVFEGFNSDNGAGDPDAFVLNASVANLDGHILSWEGTIRGFQPGAQNYFVRVRIFQGGARIAQLDEADTMNTSTAFGDFVRFRLQQQ